MIVLDLKPKITNSVNRGQSLKYSNKQCNRGNQCMKQDNVHVNLVHSYVFNISIGGVLISM